MTDDRRTRGKQRIIEWERRGEANAVAEHLGNRVGATLVVAVFLWLLPLRGFTGTLSTFLALGLLGAGIACYAMKQAIVAATSDENGSTDFLPMGWNTIGYLDANAGENAYVASAYRSAFGLGHPDAREAQPLEARGDVQFTAGVFALVAVVEVFSVDLPQFDFVFDGPPMAPEIPVYAVSMLDVVLIVFAAIVVGALIGLTLAARP